MKDMHSGLSAVVAIGAAVLSATTTSQAIDLQGNHGAELLLAIGQGGITFTASKKIEFILSHSDDGSTFTEVADRDLLGVTGVEGGVLCTLKKLHDEAGVYRYGYKGGKRYLTVQAKFSGTHGTGTPIAVTLLKGFGENQPEADQALN